MSFVMIGCTRRATGPLVTLLELVLGVGVSHALSFFFPYFMETKRNPCALLFRNFALSDIPTFGAIQSSSMYLGC